MSAVAAADAVADAAADALPKMESHHNVHFLGSDLMLVGSVVHVLAFCNLPFCLLA